MEHILTEILGLVALTTSGGGCCILWGTEWYSSLYYTLSLGRKDIQSLRCAAGLVFSVFFL